MEHLLDIRAVLLVIGLALETTHTPIQAAETQSEFITSS